MKDTRVTPAEAAKLLNVAPEQIRRWCESGDLPSYRSVHGWRKIDRKELIAFARRQAGSSAQLIGSENLPGLAKVVEATPFRTTGETVTPDDVGAALGLLQGAISDEEQRIRVEGAQAMQKGDFDTATAVIDFARRLLTFRDRVGALEQEWAEIQTMRDNATPAVQAIVSKRFFGRRGSPEITPQQDYFRPLLEVLVEMGGGGRTRDVLDRLGEKMKGILKPKDYEAHQSNAAQIRWRNTAQWARNHMVNEPSDGRMKKGTASGRWEISEKGRAWLAANPSTAS